MFYTFQRPVRTETGELLLLFPSFSGTLSPSIFGERTTPQSSYPSEIYEVYREMCCAHLYYKLSREYNKPCNKLVSQDKMVLCPFGRRQESYPFS